MKLICKTTLLAATPPFVGTEVLIRPTPEQLTWSIYSMSLKDGVSSVDVECGDGTSVTLKAGEKFIHTYPSPGIYRVRIADGVRVFSPTFKPNAQYCQTYAPLVQSVKINTPSITSIVAGSFKNCCNMATLDLRNTSLVSIPSEAFRDCHALASFDGLPPTITKIYDAAFRSCRSVSGRVDFPSVAEIVATTADAAPFLDCPGITELHFPATSATTITAHPLYSVSFGAENAAVYCDL